MASIQQSLNALSGALMGAATAGSFAYRQSEHYQNKIAENKALKLEAGAAEQAAQAEKYRQEATAAEDQGLDWQAEANAVTAQEFEASRLESIKEAYATSPTPERAKEIAKLNAGPILERKLKEKEERDLTAQAERSRELEETEAAAQAVRDLILQDERLVATRNRTADYQEQLYALRGGK